jgi:hypothetical protein
MPVCRSMVFNIQLCKTAKPVRSRFPASRVGLATSAIRYSGSDLRKLVNLELASKLKSIKLNTSRSTIGDEQDKHAPPISSSATCYSHLTTASSTESNPPSAPSTICNGTKCRSNIVLAQSDPETPPPKLSPCSFEEESQV